MNNKSKNTKQGTVKFYNEAKGFGFIIDSVTNEDVFFHRSRVNGEITRKDQEKTVTYTEFEGKKGVEANDVTIK